MEIRPKFLTNCNPLFKVTQGRWNRHRLVGYLWFPISVPYGPISYRFRYETDNCKIFQPRVFNAPDERNFETVVGL